MATASRMSGRRSPRFALSANAPAVTSAVDRLFARTASLTAPGAIIMSKSTCITATAATAARNTRPLIPAPAGTRINRTITPMDRPRPGFDRSTRLRGVLKRSREWPRWQRRPKASRREASGRAPVRAVAPEVNTARKAGPHGHESKVGADRERRAT